MGCCATKPEEGSPLKNAAQGDGSRVQDARPPRGPRRESSMKLVVPGAADWGDDELPSTIAGPRTPSHSNRPHSVGSDTAVAAAAATAEQQQQQQQLASTHLAPRESLASSSSNRRLSRSSTSNSTADLPSPVASAAAVSEGGGAGRRAWRFETPEEAAVAMEVVILREMFALEASEEAARRAIGEERDADVAGSLRHAHAALEVAVADLEAARRCAEEEACAAALVSELLGAAGESRQRAEMENRAARQKHVFLDEDSEDEQGEQLLLDGLLDENVDVGCHVRHSGHPDPRRTSAARAEAKRAQCRLEAAARFIDDSPSNSTIADAVTADTGDAGGWVLARRSKFSPSAIKRDPLIEADARLSLELDEAVYRDAAARAEQTLRVAAAQQFYSTRLLHDAVMEKGKRARGALVVMRVLPLIRLEALSRLDIECAAGREGLRLAEAVARQAARKREWVAEQARMLERRQQAKIAGAGGGGDWRARARTRSATTFLLKDSNSFVQIRPPAAAAAAPVSAVARLRAELEAVRAAAAPVTAHCRADEQRKRIAAQLCADEERCRATIATEFHVRWHLCWDDAVRVIPSLVAHPHRAHHMLRSQASLSCARRHEHELQKRCCANGAVFLLDTMDYGHSPSPQRRGESTVSEIERTKVRLLVCDESEERERIANAERDLRRCDLQAAFAAGTSTAAAHDARRAAMAFDVARRQQAAASRLAAVEKLRDAAAGAIVRHRVRLVHCVRDEVRLLLDSWRRKEKDIRRREHIARGDIEMFRDAQLTKAFPSVHRHNSAFSAGPDCVAAVEELAREALERAFAASWQAEVVAPFELGAAAARALPPEKVGVRVRAARCIQHAFRCRRNRTRFVRDIKDEMVLRRMERLKFKTRFRMLRDAEAKMRMEIEDEWASLDLFRSFFAAWSEEETRRTSAATKLASTFRGWRWREKALPVLQESKLMERLNKTRARTRSSSSSATAAAAAADIPVG